MTVISPEHETTSNLDSSEIQDRPLEKVKALFAGLEGLDDRSNIAANASRIVDRLKLPAVVLNHLFVHRQTKSMSRADWESDLRFGTCYESILAHFFSRVPLDELNDLIDQPAWLEMASRLKSPKGTLQLAFHGGFRTIQRRMFEKFFDDGFIVNQTAKKNSRGNTLFLAMRTLLEGRNVFIAPDGPFGAKMTDISVLEATCPVAQGAAFLAYETKCDTAFYKVILGHAGFAPVAEVGPKNESGETFSQFRDRLYGFYAEQIELCFTGMPRNIALGGRWVQYFRGMLDKRHQRSQSAAI